MQVLLHNLVRRVGHNKRNTNINKQQKKTRYDKDISIAVVVVTRAETLIRKVIVCTRACWPISLDFGHLIFVCEIKCELCVPSSGRLPTLECIHNHWHTHTLTFTYTYTMLNELVTHACSQPVRNEACASARFMSISRVNGADVSKPLRGGRGGA